MKKAKNHCISIIRKTICIKNNLYGWPMLQMVDVDSFKLVENASQCNKDFIENYNDDSDDGCFLEIDAPLSRLIARAP